METVSEFEQKPFNPAAAVKAYFEPKGFYVTLSRLGTFTNIFVHSKESANHHRKAAWDCPVDIYEDPVKLKEELDFRAANLLGLKI